MKYHISALYVVDLERFRSTAAGDILRGTYDQLSQDKNSLANLDQDLPNYMQHNLPIYSLPQVLFVLFLIPLSFTFFFFLFLSFSFLIDVME